MVDVTETSLFERAKAVFDRQAGENVQVTYKARIVGAADAYSGKPMIGYDDGELIDAVLVETGHAGDKQIPGVISDKQLVLFVMEEVSHLDHIVYRSVEYEVFQPPREIRFGSQYYGRIVRAQKVTGAVITDEAFDCPAGEQITNGGFETGDTTGWTTISGTPEVQGYDVRTGSYSCRNGTQDDVVIEQELAEEVPVGCFDESSVFAVWTYGFYSVSPPGGSKFKVRVTYTDDTYTDVERETTDEDKETWVEMDMVPYLTAGKTVKKITITIDQNSAGLAYIDDVSCVP